MWVSDKTMAKLSMALHIEVYQLLLPQIEGVANIPAPAEILLNLQKGLKKNIDLQFDQLFKSGLF
ncbi:hypothetical protein AGMMS49940_19020 [Spirochaetia bacterium]|nr:hypothetical protein AGMMS49940_19020 [Spirochaetia bacterium]